VIATQLGVVKCVTREMCQGVREDQVECRFFVSPSPCGSMYVLFEVAGYFSIDNLCASLVIPWVPHVVECALKLPRIATLPERVMLSSSSVRFSMGSLPPRYTHTMFVMAMRTFPMKPEAFSIHFADLTLRLMKTTSLLRLFIGVILLHAG